MRGRNQQTTSGITTGDISIELLYHRLTDLLLGVPFALNQSHFWPELTVAPGDHVDPSVAPFSAHFSLVARPPEQVCHELLELTRLQGPERFGMIVQIPD